MARHSSEAPRTFRSKACPIRKILGASLMLIGAWISACCVGAPPGLDIAAGLHALLPGVAPGHKKTRG